VPTLGVPGLGSDGSTAVQFDGSNNEGIHVADSTDINLNSVTTRSFEFYFVAYDVRCHLIPSNSEMQVALAK
jgi:hypothetical protein